MGGFGAFGKTPALGDFFHFGLSRAFVSAWDVWLQSAVRAARSALGEAWQQRYCSAPIWRFSLSPGLAGTEGMLGVLMPSVDRVGRHFPLTLAAPVPSGRPTLDLHLAAEATFVALEVIALDTLALRTGLPGLQRDLASLRPSFLVQPAEVAVRPGRMILRVQDGSLAAGLGGWAMLQAGFRAPSVWSTVADVESRLMILDGLPDHASARGLFDLAAPAWRADGTGEDGA